MDIREMKAKVRGLAGEANSIVALADKEDRKLTDTEHATVSAKLGEASQLREAIEKSAPEQWRADKAAFASQINSLSHIGMNDETAPPSKIKDVKRFRAGSAGEVFVNSNEYGELLATRGASNWHKRRVQSDPVGLQGMRLVKGWNSSKRNELVTGTSPEMQGEAFGADNTAGLLVQPEFGGVLPPTYQRELTVRDLVSVLPTSSDTIEYVKIASVTNRAAAVPEATSSATEDPDSPANPGGFKPESALTFSEEREHVRTIAHTMPVTKKALADAPQIRAIIDTFLRYGLEEKVEDLILDGDGTGENFTGILDPSRTGVQRPTFEVGDDLLVKARKAKTLSRLARAGRPTAYLMHPLTAEEYYLTKDAEDRFRAGGPFADQEPGLWGLPIVQSEAMTEGEVLIGNFRQAVYYDRQQASLTATDSHMDFFVRNLVMILAEVRGGFTVLQENTFVVFDTTTES